MSLGSQREHFDIPEGISYLNAAYLSPLAHSVRKAGHVGIDRKARPWEIVPADFFTETPVLRREVGRLLEAPPESIALHPSTSYGTAIAARNLTVGAGRSVLLLEEQYPSNYYVWKQKAEREGGSIRVVRRPGQSTSWSDAVGEAIDSTTAIVALPHVHWSDGTLFDLAAISARAREVGARIVLDLTQSLGVLPCPVAQIDPDFVVAAAYKWLLGPYSIGFCYVAPRHHEGVPIEQSWLIRRGSEDFANLAHYTDELYRDARRFDVGESTNFALVPMAIAALELLHSWGIDAVRARIAQLAQRLRAGAAELGIDAPPPERSAPHIVGLQFPGEPSEGLVQALTAQRIYVSLRGKTLRVSPHVYNDEADIDRLLAALPRA